MKTSLIISIAFVVAACGGSDVDLTGIYLVTHHTQNESDCAVEGAAVEDGKPYFQMKKEEFLGLDIFTCSECDTAEESSCTGGGLLASFMQPVDNGWKQQSMSSGFNDQCYLSYGESSALRQEDDSLRIEIRSWGGDVTLSEEDCNTDEAEDRGKDMPCEDFQVIVGTLVESE